MEAVAVPIRTSVMAEKLLGEILQCFVLAFSHCSVDYPVPCAILPYGNLSLISLIGSAKSKCNEYARQTIAIDALATRCQNHPITAAVDGEWSELVVM
jgi:hypothetical protein